MSDKLNETFNKHRFLLKKKLYEQGVIQQPPIQEVELEEGFKDIALAGLLGLSTLLMTAKDVSPAIQNTPDATASSGEERGLRTGQLGVIQPLPFSKQNIKSYTSFGSEISDVKIAKQKAESLAVNIAEIYKNKFGLDKKDDAEIVLKEVTKFNKENPLGSVSQIKFAIELAESKGDNISSGPTKQNNVDLISKIPYLRNLKGNTWNELDIKVSKDVHEIAETYKTVLAKKYNIADNSELSGKIYSHCESAALGDFMQIVAQKLTEIVNNP